MTIDPLAFAGNDNDPGDTLPPDAPPTDPAPPGDATCASCRRAWWYCECDVEDCEPARTWPAIGGGR